MWGEETARREKRRLVVEERLQRVLSEGGLRVDYQPVVALDGGALVGAEALLRVRDHDDEVLNPAEFVEAAESAGLLARLGTQMLEATCEQLSRWDAQLRSRAPDHVCVNVSPRQLLDPGLATQVVAALEASALDPGRLWLEVTESTLLDQSDELGHRIAFLRDLGVQVGLDEFGAGYSTLNYLKRFPLDFVKIDRTPGQRPGPGPTRHRHRPGHHRAGPRAGPHRGRGGRRDAVPSSRTLAAAGLRPRPGLPVVAAGRPRRPGCGGLDRDLADASVRHRSARQPGLAGLSDPSGGQRPELLFGLADLGLDHAPGPDAAEPDEHGPEADDEESAGRQRHGADGDDQPERQQARYPG